MSGYDLDAGYAGLNDGDEIPCSPRSGWPAFVKFRKLKCQIYKTYAGLPNRTATIRVS
jgi:hypothetical protein